MRRRNDNEDGNGDEGKYEMYKEEEVDNQDDNDDNDDDDGEKSLLENAVGCFEQVLGNCKKGKNCFMRVWL